jgi:pimeloyl-ACP methyl ester carboxylesterase
MSWHQHDTARSHFIDSTDRPGLRLHIRARADDPARPPVLFVHGATYASRLYDIPHPGASWMEAAAQAGFAAYAVDVRGYGLSHSAAMETLQAPYARATDAIRDIDDAVNWIAACHGVSEVSMIGGSWGSITTALYAGTIGAGKVAQLVLYAPIYAELNPGWLEFLCDPADPGAFNPNFGAFRQVTEAGTRARWDAEMPAGADWRDEGVFQALVQSSLADDPSAFQGQTLLDLWEAFNGRPVYDPAGITCPVLLIRGGADPTSTRSDALALFDVLENAEDRRYLEIANGAHFISAERRAPAVFAAVNGFLAEAIGRR